jgi:hypothetical protein
MTNDPYLNEQMTLQEIITQHFQGEMPQTISCGMKAIKRNQPFTPRGRGDGANG